MWRVPPWGVLVVNSCTRPLAVTAVVQYWSKVVASKPVHDRFVSLGAEPKSSTPEEFAQLVRTDVARWARVVKEANIKLD